MCTEMVNNVCMWVGSDNVSLKLFHGIFSYPSQLFNVLWMIRFIPPFRGSAPDGVDSAREQLHLQLTEVGGVRTPPTAHFTAGAG
mmetsp:Transcript_11675/g.13876  ORF Transcript_11675/g.13876 Transcript_11675/m.13876 type:complete len:85 (+) Transcript_11675:626-880(+)